MTLPEAQTMAEAMHWEPVTPENRREVLATRIDCRNRLRALGHLTRTQWRSIRRSTSAVKPCARRLPIWKSPVPS